MRRVVLGRRLESQILDRSAGARHLGETVEEMRRGWGVIVEDAVAVVVQAVCQGASSAITRGTDAAVAGGYTKLMDLLFRRQGASRDELAARQQQLEEALRALAETIDGLGAELTTDEVQAAAEVVRTDARSLQNTWVSDSHGVVTGAVGGVITMNFGAEPREPR